MRRQVVRWAGSIIWIGGIGLTLGQGAFTAQASWADELGELKAQMRSMQEQMRTMQARIVQLEASPPSDKPQPESLLKPLAEKVTFHGSADMTYMDYGKQGYRNGDSTFDSYETYLAALANIAEDVTLYVEPRYEHGSDTVELRQAYMDWQLAEPLRVRMGKFYMPIGSYQKSYYNSLRKLVEYHYSMRLINVAPWEDTGFEALGELPLGPTDMKLNYAFAMVNGLDADYTQNSSNTVRNARQNRDNNSNKTVGGRLGLVPLKGLEVGVSWNTGKYDNNARYRLDFFDVDAAYTLGDLELKGEYVQSRAQSTSGQRRTDGFYLEGAYKVLKEFLGMRYLELVAAFDVVNPGQALNDRFLIAKGQQIRKTSLGLNLSPRKHFLLKTEYQFTQENSPSIDDNAFLVQTVVDF